jgi:hypothetical protein
MNVIMNPPNEAAVTTPPAINGTFHPTAFALYWHGLCGRYAPPPLSSHLAKQQNYLLPEPHGQCVSQMTLTAITQPPTHQSSNR